MSPPTSLYVRVLRELRGSGRELALFLGAAAFAALSQGLVALAAGLLGRAFLQAGTVERGDDVFSTLAPMTVAAMGLGAALLKTLASTYAADRQKRIASRVANGCRVELADHLLRGGASLPTGATLARATEALRGIERGVDAGVIGGARAALALVPMTAALVLLSTELALYALLLLLPFAIGLSLLRRRLKRRAEQRRRDAEALQLGLDEIVRHCDVWRTFGARRRMLGTLDRLSRRSERGHAAVARTQAGLSSANEALAALVLFAVVALVDTGSIHAERGGLVAFAAVFFLLYRPLRELGDARSAVTSAETDLAAIGSLAPPVATAVETGAHGEAPFPAARLDVDVTLDLPGRPRVRFGAEPGQLIAIHGPTGSGKTTLFRTLLGFCEPLDGAVRYDGRVLKAGVGPERRPFAWAPQDAPVFAGTLTENLLLGAADDGVSARDLLIELGAERLAGRVDQLVADHTELSGGQRKWIAVGRAVASGQPVLLLDEPTAGLDPSAEQELFRALERIKARATILVATHVPLPAGLADHTLAIDEAAPTSQRQPIAL